jgi:hypothetical protein
MWAVGKITKSSGSFDIPMMTFAIAAAVAAFAGCLVTRNPARVGVPAG